MRHLPGLTRRAGVIMGLATPAYLLTLTTALAHSGHAQADHGFGANGLLDIAGTAAAIVIAYVLATWFLRSRDRADRHRDEEPRQTPGRRAEPDHDRPPPLGDIRQSG